MLHVVLAADGVGVFSPVRAWKAWRGQNFFVAGFHEISFAGNAPMLSLNSAVHSYQGFNTLLWGPHFLFVNDTLTTVGSQFRIYSKDEGVLSFCQITFFCMKSICLNMSSVVQVVRERRNTGMKEVRVFLCFCRYAIMAWYVGHLHVLRLHFLYILWEFKYRSNTPFLISVWLS